MRDESILSDTSDAARSQAARLLQRSKRRRPPETLRIRLDADRRTRGGRACRQLEAALLAHCGGKPSAAQAALIEQLLQLKLRLVLMDMAFAAAEGRMSGHDSRQYLAWSNSFVRGLKALGLDNPPEASPSLADYLAGRTHQTPAPQPGGGDSNAATPWDDMA
jgi:hypothetical protein